MNCSLGENNVLDMSDTSIGSQLDVLFSPAQQQEIRNILSPGGNIDDRTVMPLAENIQK